MARKKTYTPPQYEPEAAPASTPLEDASSGKAITKAEAVRQALSAGCESPGDIAGFAKSRFGLEIPKTQVSAYKSLARKRAAATHVAIRRGRKPKALIEGYVAPPTRVKPTGDGDLLDALTAMKPLIAQYGAAKVKQLVDLLG